MPEDVTQDVVENLNELSVHLDAAQVRLDRLRKAMVAREVRQIADLEEALTKRRSDG